jgi:hypothetical protein
VVATPLTLSPDIDIDSNAEGESATTTTLSRNSALTSALTATRRLFGPENDPQLENSSLWQSRQKNHS